MLLSHCPVELELPEGRDTIAAHLDDQDLGQPFGDLASPRTDCMHVSEQHDDHGCLYATPKKSGPIIISQFMYAARDGIL